MINVIARVVAREYWENVADNLSKAGWSLGRISAVDSRGRRSGLLTRMGAGKRYIVRADEKLTVFLEGESAIAKDQHSNRHRRALPTANRNLCFTHFGENEGMFSDFCSDFAV